MKNTTREIYNKFHNEYSYIVDYSSILMDKYFPKGECKERSKALIFNGELIHYMMLVMNGTVESIEDRLNQEVSQPEEKAVSGVAKDLCVSEEYLNKTNYQNYPEISVTTSKVENNTEMSTNTIDLLPKEKRCQQTENNTKEKLVYKNNIAEQADELIKKSNKRNRLPEPVMRETIKPSDDDIDEEWSNYIDNLFGTGHNGIWQVGVGEVMQLKKFIEQLLSEKEDELQFALGEITVAQSRIRELEERSFSKEEALLIADMCDRSKGEYCIDGDEWLGYLKAEDKIRKIAGLERDEEFDRLLSLETK